MLNLNQHLKKFLNPQKGIISRTILFIVLSILALNVVFTEANVDQFIKFSTYSSLIVFTIFIIQEIILLIPVAHYLQEKVVTLKDLGFKKANLGKSAGFVLLGFLIFISINFAITIFSLTNNVQIPGYSEQAPYLPLFGSDPFSTIIAVITLIFLAPLAEEMLFRGLIYNELKKRHSIQASMALSALIFAVFHMDFAVIIPLFLLGYIIAWIYENTGTIWAVIAFHMLNNSLAFFAEIFLISQT